MPDPTRNNNSEPDEAPPAESSPSLEPWFVYTVGALLLAIVAGLTGVSMRFHRQASVAQMRLREAEAELGRTASAMQILGQSLAQFAPPLRRGELTRVEAELDGKRVTIFDLGAEKGRFLGLKTGDILRVLPVRSPPTASSPSPGAASRPQF